MDNRFRLVQNTGTQEFRFERRRWDPRNEPYWEVEPTKCPQDRTEALKVLAALNYVEKWVVIA